MCPNPMFLVRDRKARLQHTVPGNLRHINRAQFVHLRRDSILFNQRIFAVMNDERIIGGQCHIQSALKEKLERIAVILNEEQIVRQWRHGQSNLFQVKQVLQHGHFLQRQTVINGLRQQESSSYMIKIARFTGMWSIRESIESAVFSELIENKQIGVDIVRPYNIGRILVLIPLRRLGIAFKACVLANRFVIDRIKTSHQR
mmetsp:Transcript_15745/g.24155  ORF Transcript_15745/g.24155 Transcript_15745/m.24155 type:complete len:201 (+) Transcript_15745:207-809(+)